MIEVKNLTKYFDDYKALDNATLNIPDGSVYGLAGPNGSGKTTIIKHILGVYKSDAGSVLLDGENVYDNAQAKAKIAAIPDDWFFYTQATIKDMMKFYRDIYKSFNMERYNKLKEVFNIPEKKPIRHLSKGMQKQVAFWLAMSTMPKYLVLDEPVDGLDPVMRRQVWSLMMEDVVERGTTVLVSSHNLRELEDVCDHVGIIDRGKLLLERNLSDLQDNMVKIQIVFQNDEVVIPKELSILNHSNIGKVHTLIVRENSENAIASLKQVNPVLIDAIPLTLEEIFIYELGGVDYEVKSIIL